MCECIWCSTHMKFYLHRIWTLRNAQEISRLLIINLNPCEKNLLTDSIWQTLELIAGRNIFCSPSFPVLMLRFRFGLFYEKSFFFFRSSPKWCFTWQIISAYQTEQIRIPYVILMHVKTFPVNHQSSVCPITLFPQGT